MVNTVKFSQFAQANLNTASNTLVGITSPTGGTNIQTPFTTGWTTATRPTAPYNGLMGYNSTLGVPEYWQTSAWVQLTGGGGSVIQVNTGTGLDGGPITTVGTISFAPIAAFSLWANNTNALNVPQVIPISTFLQSANNLSELTDAATARTNLFLSADVGDEGQVLISNGVTAPPFWGNSSSAGVVEPGVINQIAYYAATGDTVSGLATNPRGVLVTDPSGVPFISIQGQIPASSDGSLAANGNIGQIYSSVIPSSSSVPITTNNLSFNITSIPLDEGDYDVWGNVAIVYTSGSYSAFGCWISLVSAAHPDNSLVNVMSGFIMQGNNGLSCAGFPLTLNAPATLYLSAQLQFTTLSARACGGLYVRRIR